MIATLLLSAAAVAGLAAFIRATRTRPPAGPDDTMIIEPMPIVCVRCAVDARDGQYEGPRLAHSRRCGGPCLCPQPAGHDFGLCARCGGRRMSR